MFQVGESQTMQHVANSIKSKGGGVSPHINPRPFHVKTKNETRFLSILYVVNLFLMWRWVSPAFPPSVRFCSQAGFPRSISASAVRTRVRRVAKSTPKSSPRPPNRSRNLHHVPTLFKNWRQKEKQNKSNDVKTKIKCAQKTKQRGFQLKRVKWRWIGSLTLMAFLSVSASCLKASSSFILPAATG